MPGVETLLSLHRSLAHSGQIEAWEADLKAFDGLKADYEDELRRVRGEAYQVAILYAAFQGVVFTAVSQPNLLSCSLWWCPVSLSVAVSVAAFLAIANQLYFIGELKEDLKETGLDMAAIVQQLDLVKEEGANLDLNIAQPRQEAPRDKHAGYRCIASRDGIFALLFLTLFSVLIVRFSYGALCRHCTPCS